MAIEKRVDQIIKNISNLDSEEIVELIKKLRNIPPIAKQWREYDEDQEYFEIVNESLKEVWDNEEDDVYNDL